MGEKDDFEVVFGGLARAGRDFVRSAPPKDGIEIKEDERRQSHEKEQFERHQLADEFFARGQIFCAQLNRKDGGMACANQDAKGGKHHHERIGQGEACHGIRAATLANVKAVNDAIKRVEGHGDEGGP